MNEVLKNDAEYHAKKASQLLVAHPEIKDLYGPYPASLFFIVVLVLLQWTIAAALVGHSLLEIFLVVFFLGQFILHALVSFVHETTHHLVLKGERPSLFVLWLIELGVLYFGSVYKYYRKHGVCHHAYLSVYARDSELLDLNEVEFLSKHFVWRYLCIAIFLLPGGAFLIGKLQDYFISGDSKRVLSRKPKSVSFKRILLFTNLILYIVSALYLGWEASLYFLWCASLLKGYWGISFQGQNLREHHIRGEGLTYSAYGCSNFVLFNQGFHDEHHTFAQIPWVYLPKVRALAKDQFNDSGSKTLLGWWWDWARTGFHPRATYRVMEPS